MDDLCADVPYRHDRVLERAECGCVLGTCCGDYVVLYPQQDNIGYRTFSSNSQVHHLDKDTLAKCLLTEC